MGVCMVVILERRYERRKKKKRERLCAPRQHAEGAQKNRRLGWRRERGTESNLARAAGRVRRVEKTYTENESVCVGCGFLCPTRAARRVKKAGGWGWGVCRMRLLGGGGGGGVSAAAEDTSEQEGAFFPLPTPINRSPLSDASNGRDRAHQAPDRRITGKPGRFDLPRARGWSVIAAREGAGGDGREGSDRGGEGTSLSRAEDDERSRAEPPLRAHALPHSPKGRAGYDSSASVDPSGWRGLLGDGGARA